MKTVSDPLSAPDEGGNDPRLYVQEMDGVGTPVALHTKVTFPFSEIIRPAGSLTISGRTETKKEHTVKPLLSGHPRDFSKCPLNRRCPLNRGLL